MFSNVLSRYSKVLDDLIELDQKVSNNSKQRLKRMNEALSYTFEHEVNSESDQNDENEDDELSDASAIESENESSESAENGDRINSTFSESECTSNSEFDSYNKSVSSVSIEPKVELKKEIIQLYSSEDSECNDEKIVLKSTTNDLRVLRGRIIERNVPYAKNDRNLKKKTSILSPKPAKIPSSSEETSISPKIWSKQSILKLIRKVVSEGKSTYSCLVCTYRSRNIAQTVNHIRTVHRKERQYKCKECGIRFVSKQAVGIHIRAVHRKERPFKCKQCAKCFARKATLNMHIKTVHKMLKPFECAECGKFFTTKAHVEQHILSVHRKEKPFKCEECGKYFSDKGNLTKHIRWVHKNEKLYKCDECGMRGKTKQSLDIHVRVIHRKEKPFQCHECGQKFGRKHHLKGHIAVFHELNNSKVKH